MLKRRSKIIYYLKTGRFYRQMKLKKWLKKNKNAIINKQYDQTTASIILGYKVNIDEPTTFNELIKINLELQGHEVIQAFNGIEGFAFRNGKITHPVREMVITGNMLTLWSRLIHAGNDARACTRWQIPSLSFEKVDFSG